MLTKFEFIRQQASTKTLTAGGPSTSYGSTTAPSRFDSGDLDELFPERVHHRSPSVCNSFVFVTITAFRV
jgi:hypothetical protein